MSKPKIYGFINGGSPGLLNVEAISEDGVFLAAHGSSSEGWGQHDLGCDGASEWKHEYYRAYYPDGFEAIWVGSARDPRVELAYKNHLAHTKEEYSKKFAPVRAVIEEREKERK